MTEGTRPTLLLTAFGPFGGDSYNPSEHALQPAAKAASPLAHVVTDVLPVEYASAAARIRHIMRTHRPDVVVSVGVAAGRSSITPERVALNLAEARIPDETAAQPAGLPLVDGAAPAYFSTLPLAAMMAAAQDEGVPAVLSYSAGTFVCNAVMYAALDEARALFRKNLTAPEAIAGFIHVPSPGSSPAVAKPVSAVPKPLTQEEINRGVAACVRAAVIHRGEVPVAPRGSLEGPAGGSAGSLLGGGSAGGLLSGGSAGGLLGEGPGGVTGEDRSDARMPGIGATE